MAFKNYFHFEGRACRKEFCYFILFHLIILFILGIISEKYPQLWNLFATYTFIAIIPGIAIVFRRLHDVGKTDLLWFTPFWIFVIFRKGMRGANYYGQYPLEEIEKVPK